MTTAHRAPSRPEVPTIAEGGRTLGLPSFDINPWFGLFGPAGLPAATTQRPNRAFVDARNAIDIRSRFAALLAEPAPSTPEAFARWVQAELTKYERVVKASGATVA